MKKKNEYYEPSNCTTIYQYAKLDVRAQWSKRKVTREVVCRTLGIQVLGRSKLA